MSFDHLTKEHREVLENDNRDQQPRKKKKKRSIKFNKKYLLPDQLNAPCAIS